MLVAGLTGGIGTVAAEGKPSFPGDQRARQIVPTARLTAGDQRHMACRCMAQVQRLRAKVAQLVLFEQGDQGTGIARRQIG